MLLCLKEELCVWWPVQNSGLSSSQRYNTGGWGTISEQAGPDRLWSPEPRHLLPPARAADSPEGRLSSQPCRPSCCFLSQSCLRKWPGSKVGSMGLASHAVQLPRGPHKTRVSFQSLLRKPLALLSRLLFTAPLT